MRSNSSLTLLLSFSTPLSLFACTTFNFVILQRSNWLTKNSTPPIHPPYGSCQFGVLCYIYIKSFELSNNVLYYYFFFFFLRSNTPGYLYIYIYIIGWKCKRVLCRGKMGLMETTTAAKSNFRRRLYNVVFRAASFAE